MYMYVGKSEKTVCDWKSKFYESGEVPDSKQGKYIRSGVLWTQEDLNKKATQYTREHASPKG